MCGNRVLGKTSWSEEEKTRNWRKLHDVELYDDLYRLVNVTGVLKPRRKRWAGHVTCVGAGYINTGYQMETSEGRRRLGRPRHKWKREIKTRLI